MTLDQPAYSFDQAKPLTPSRTPTSPAFDGNFQTPKIESSFYDPRVTWNTADPNSESPNLLRTPRPLSFGQRGDRLTSSFEQAQAGQSGFGIGAHAQAVPTTPNAPSRTVNQSPGIGYTPNFGAEAQHSANSPLTLDTSNSFNSAGSIQTPPPTGSSTVKKQRQKKKAVKDSAVSQPQQSGTSRRMSVPSGSRPNRNGPNASQVEASPQQFAPLDFSPDVLAYNFAAPATAPAYPQHKLFWGPDGDGGADLDFGDDIATSFAQQGFDHFASDGDQRFISQGLNSSTFLDFTDDTTPVASFAQNNTNPGPSQSQNEGNNPSQSHNGVDPSLLFSSPSKLPQPLDGAGAQSRVLTEESLQPYAYQHQEAKRENRYGGIEKSRKRRKPSVDSPAVRAALENLRGGEGARPLLHRSMTDSNLPAAPRVSSSSRPPSTHGRSSPLKRVRESTRRSSRPSVSLSIDVNGRARLIEAPGNADEMDVDSNSDDSSESDGENVDEMLATSFAPRNTLPKLGRFSSSASHSQKSSNTSLYSDSQPSLPEHKQRLATSGPSANHPRLRGVPPLQPLHERMSMEEDIPSEAETVIDSEDEADAQAHLRKVMRSREAGRSSRPMHHHYSPHSKQGSTFVSQNDFLNNLSPTTMTDPDLATPSSTTSGGSETIRCTCNGMGDDGQMIQCESCRKWLHVPCTGLHHPLPKVYLCLFCTGQTPTVRGGRVRDPSRKSNAPNSPLAQKAPKFR